MKQFTDEELEYWAGRFRQKFATQRRVRAAKVLTSFVLTAAALVFVFGIRWANLWGQLAGELK